GAIEQLEIAVSRSPQWPEPLFMLATAYARADRLPDAIRDYREVIDLRPKHYGANLLLGRALALSGDPNSAIAPLSRAAELQPNSAEPHAFLADVFAQLGRQEDAARERSAAARLRTGTTR
ncbi:MAG TPA: tetratricopeptide repeat protein, partial [Candidatus Acidoferrales bacterium]|nr:tetratricopeptide repeat protein [Candidatus Acidoferrales bacterium]